MSQIDLYQPCVCGSGKKFKFCKCGATDQLPELERITRLVDGDQDLAALDRINGLLGKSPNSAWLLALKTRLLLQLNERKSFIETANRFLKLKPDNPLALLFSSIGAYFNDDPPQVQARYLLAGMAESRQGFPSVFPLAVEVMVNRIVREENPAFLGLWGTMQLGYEGREGERKAIQSDAVHLLCKIPNRVIEPPAGAPWLERLDEVLALESTFRYELVEKKIQSILREFPNQPGPLSLLLKAQVAQLDRDGAIATARKLAENSELTADDRTYFRALAAEYELNALKAGEIVRYGEVEFDDETVEKLRSLDSTMAVDSEPDRYYASQLIGEDVPAKHVFVISHDQEVNGQTLHTQVGSLYLFGKQTDRPARAMLIAFDYPPFRPVVDEILSIIGSIQALESPVQSNGNYTTFLLRPAQYDSSAETIEEFAQRLIEEFLNFPLPYLDGKSPLEASTQPELAETLKALVLHLECDPAFYVPSATFNEIYKRLNLVRPTPAAPTGANDEELAKNWALTSIVNLAHFDWSTFPEQLLISAFNSTVTLDFQRGVVELANEIISRPTLTEAPKVELGVRQALASLAPKLDDRLAHSLRAIELLKKLNTPVGQQVMFHAAILQRAERFSEAAEFIRTMLREHPDDQQLMMLVQYAMSQSTSRMPRQDTGLESALTGESSSALSSSLVLPGETQSSQGESKLWLPGT